MKAIIRHPDFKAVAAEFFAKWKQQGDDHCYYMDASPLASNNAWGMLEFQGSTESQRYIAYQEAVNA